MSPGKRISISSIVDQVRKFNQQLLLLAISRCVARLDSQPGRMEDVLVPVRIGSHVVERKVTLATHSLATLTRITLAHGNQRARREPTDLDIGTLDTRVRQLPAYMGTQPLGTQRPGFGMESLREALFQMAYDQFPMQINDEMLQIGRSILLFEKIPQILRQEGETPPIEIGNAIREVYGMTMRQFMATGFLTYKYAQAQAGNTMRISEFHRFLDNALPGRWMGEEHDRPTSKSFDLFLQSTARNYEWFRKEIGNLTSTDERFTRVEKWPLLAYPIVRLNDDEILAPIPKMLIDRVASGVFHDLANHFQGAKGNSFRDYFGRIFERYVGHHLEQVFPLEDLIPETQYTVEGQTRSTPDWTVNSSFGAIVMECRSSSFKRDTRKFADMPHIIKDLERIGTDPLVNGCRKIDDLKANKTEVKLKRTDNVRFGLCTFERLMPLGFFGTLLADQIPELVESGFQFYIMPLAELELICAYQNPAIFIQAIDALTFDERWRLSFDEGEKRFDSVIQVDPDSSIVHDAAAEFFGMFGVVEEGGTC